MATETPLIRDGGNCIAAANYYNPASALQGPGGSGQFLAVKLSTAADRTVTLASSGGEAVYGILQNTPKAGEAANVGILGVTKAVYGGTVTRGDELMTDTSGRLITATSTNHRVAVALESGVSGQVGTVALVPLGRTTA